MTARRKEFRYGLIGCGGFGLFCLEQYASMPDLVIRAVADVDADAARAAAERSGADFCETPDDLLARDDVDVVHIATPPCAHRDGVLRALDAGKHVLCEKPLATTLDDARMLVDAARQRKRLLAVNLIMRYDPLCLVVKRLIERKLLGEPLHAFFENYAKDEPLPAGHWFWDVAQSGGIFIEHGVHFFDLFAWWLGPGRVASAHAAKRPDADIVEHVNATCVYADGVLVNFYHGFHQAERMDRQEMRLVFERGSIALDEWVPIRLRMDAILDERSIDALRQLMPGARVITEEKYAGGARQVTSRHKSYFVDRRVSVNYDLGLDKLDLYGHVLRELLAEQLASIDHPRRKRRITAENGVTSLELAVEADRLCSHPEE